MTTPDMDAHERALLDQLFDKWSLLVLNELCVDPLRFSELKSRLDGVTSKSLTETLRRLERNGMLHREVRPGPPVSVEYRATDLARTLEEPVRTLIDWVLTRRDEVERARDAYEARAAEPAPPALP